MCSEALDELDDLSKYIKMSRKEYKKEATRRRQNSTAAREFGACASESEGGPIDVTDDVLNCFVHFDVQRRFFNIVTMEILAMQFGLKAPVSVTELKQGCTPVSLQNLVVNGRNLSIEQYFEYKDELESDKKEMEQLYRDRQTHILYTDGVGEPNSALLEDDSGDETESLRSRSDDQDDQDQANQRSYDEESKFPPGSRSASASSLNSSIADAHKRHKGGRVAKTAAHNRQFNKSTVDQGKMRGTSTRGGARSRSRGSTFADSNATGCSLFGAGFSNRGSKR